MRVATTDADIVQLGGEIADWWLSADGIHFSADEARLTVPMFEPVERRLWIFGTYAKAPAAPTHSLTIESAAEAEWTFTP